MVEASDFWMNRSPGFPWVKAKSTSSTASSRFMRNRVISGSVMVMGLPARIWSMKRGITLPRLHITLPYRVQQMTVPPRSAATRALA